MRVRRDGSVIMKTDIIDGDMEAIIISIINVSVTTLTAYSQDGWIASISTAMEWPSSGVSSSLPDDIRLMSVGQAARTAGHPSS